MEPFFQTTSSSIRPSGKKFIGMSKPDEIPLSTWLPGQSLALLCKHGTTSEVLISLVSVRFIRMLWQKWSGTLAKVAYFQLHACILREIFTANLCLVNLPRSSSQRVRQRFEICTASETLKSVAEATEHGDCVLSDRRRPFGAALKSNFHRWWN